MNKEIPHIKFAPAATENIGFEIVSIDKISKFSSKRDHNSELPHQLDFFIIIFFTEGTGRHFVDFKWYPVEKNNLIYLAKEQVHAFEFSEGLKGHCIIFTEEYFVNCFSVLNENFVFRLLNPELFSPILQIPEKSDFINYFNLLLKEYNSEGAFSQRTIVDALFTILISKSEDLKQNQTNYFKHASKVTLYQNFTSLIREHYANSRSADFYANELAVTYKHLNTVCKELVKKTAKSVIDDFIILKAKRNLINASYNIAELAYKLGFEDPTNFTKYFKKHTALTPKAFILAVSKL